MLEVYVNDFRVWQFYEKYVSKDQIYLGVSSLLESLMKLIE